MSGPNEAPRPEPEALGRFALRRTLGEGGTATVFEAVDGDRTVALKVLRSDLALSDRERERFLREAERMRRVRAPGLIELLDSGELPDGRPFITMPVVRGETLLVRAQREPLDPVHAVEIISTLAETVQLIHDAGLIHRDIKPENVVLDSDGTPKLLDFGIARDVDAKSSTTTQTGGVRGTPAYMAPERFFGVAASVATDVYELGVLLYFLLTGALPWSDESGAAGRLDPRDPTEHGRDLPGPLRKLVLATISTRPEQRPRSARELGERAARALRESASQKAAPRATGRTTATLRADSIDRSGDTVPPSSPEPEPVSSERRTTERTRRERARRIWPAALALTSLVGVTVAGWRLARDGDEADPGGSRVELPTDRAPGSRPEERPTGLGARPKERSATATTGTPASPRVSSASQRTAKKLSAARAKTPLAGRDSGAAPLESAAPIGQPQSKADASSDHSRYYLDRK